MNVLSEMIGVIRMSLEINIVFQPEGKMELKNLDINILHKLTREGPRYDTRKIVDIKKIYEIFADVPSGHITAALEDLQAKGWLHIQPDRSKLSLTSKGAAKIKSVHRRLRIFPSGL